MSITFASGGFSGTMRSDADGNIFVETQGDSKTITIGSVAAYTGSVIKELDPSTGNVLFQKEYKSDGTIEESKFKASGERMETKVKNPNAGKEFIRSGSATANQIEFEQTTAGAFITVSGSAGSTGFNMIETDKFKLIRSALTQHIKGTTLTTIGINQVDSSGNWEYNINSGLLKTRTAATQFTVSASGDLFVKNDISASGYLDIGTISASNNVYVTGDVVATGTGSFGRIESTILSSSIIFSSGSNIFGDAAVDTHTFNGAITASGNISASGKIYSSGYFKNGVALFSNPSFTGNITASGNISSSGQLIAASADFNDGNISNVGTIDLDNIRGDGDTDTNIAFGGDKITFTAGNIEMLKLVEGVADAVTINEGGVDVNLRVESSNKTHMLFVDAGNDAVGIGNSVPSTELTVEGAISSSTGISSSNATFTGDISANSAAISSHITASGNISSSGTITSKIFNAIQGGNSSAQGLRFDNRADQGIFGHGFFTSIMAPESITMHIDSNGNGTTEYFNVVKDQKLVAQTTNELFRVQEDGNVGIGTTSPVTKLQVAGNISSSGDFLNSQFVQMTNSSSVINTFDTGSHQTCKYLLQVKSGSDVQSSEMLLIQHGLTSSNTEYAQVNSGLNLVDFTTAISASTVQLIASSSFLSCSVKFIRTLI